MVALKNTALTSQGPVQGAYQLSVKINGDQSWISNDNGKAIWYNPEKYIWLIGSEENIGGEIGSFYAPRIPGSGPDNDRNVWSYHHNGWKTDNANDVSVACKGKNPPKKLRQGWHYKNIITVNLITSNRLMPCPSLPQNLF